MEHTDEQEPRPIRVTDRRVSSMRTEQGEAAASPKPEGTEVSQTVALQEFDALREKSDQLLYQLSSQQDKLKRMTREHTKAIASANKDLIANLLPVLDNFDRAIAHADDASGLEIVYRDLLSTLQDEGLEEIPAEGLAFDYHVHDAMASHEDPDVATETVTEVLLKGYRLKDEVLRHAKVVVAHPAPDDRSSDQQAEG